MIASIEKFLDIASKDPVCQIRLSTSGELCEKFAQVQRSVSSARLQKKKKVLFGTDSFGAFDVRFIAYDTLAALDAAAEHCLKKLPEHTPSIADASLACSPDTSSTPLLLSLSSDIFESDVWIDERDPSYISNMLFSLLCSLFLFENDIARSDARKKDMLMSLLPAALRSQMLGASADEIFHKAETPVDFTDLEAHEICGRIRRYNARISVYQKICRDIAKR